MLDFTIRVYSPDNGLDHIAEYDHTFENWLAGMKYLESMAYSVDCQIFIIGDDLIVIHLN